MLSPNDCLFSYQPVLDRKSQTVAIAVHYQQDESAFLDSEDDIDVTARVVVNAYLNSEVVDLLGLRKVFVKIDANFLASGMISMLPAQRTVLELAPHDLATEAAVELCKDFRRMGYSFALRDCVLTKSVSELLDAVDIVKLNINSMPRDKLTEAVESLREMPIKLLAEKVESQHDFDECLELGFDFFQGHYIAHAKVLVGRQPDPRRANILKMLSCIDQEAGDKEIEDALKFSPDLILHLLRLVNSAAFGLRTQVGSMREALNLFGRSKLEKWLQILLFISSESDDGGGALFELAAKRGRIIELLVQDVTHQRGALQQDRGFMVGMLSLVDVLLGAPMEEILPEIGVVEEIQQAVLIKSGTLGVLLQICEALEVSDFDTVTKLAASCSISLARVMEVQREATLWAKVVAEESAASAS